MSDTSQAKPFGLREASPLTAEIVSAQRARWTNTPEAKALVTFTGQVLMNVYMALAPDNIVNIGPVREIGMDYLVDQEIGDGAGKLFIDLACGFSSRGATIAKAIPELSVIEIDLANIISQKKTRYRRAGINLPGNHRFIVADLKNVNLLEILDGRKADVIMSRGLLIYFTEDDIRAAAQNIATALKPGGLFVADVVRGDDLELSSFQRVIEFFRRQTTSDASVGRFKDKIAAETAFKESGYERVTVYSFSDIEKEVKVPTPYLDQMMIVAARVGAEGNDQEVTQAEAETPASKLDETQPVADINLNAEDTKPAADEAQATSTDQDAKSD